MIEADPWLRFMLAALAVWRATHLVALEDGPGQFLARLRGALGDSWGGMLMDCFYCLSLWIAAPLAFWMADHPAGFFVAWLALSGAACLLEAATAPPLMMEHLQGASNELLRNETGGDAERTSLRDSVTT